jgi:hypothetical protein
MRSIAVVLCAALFGLNAEAAFLHVHEGEATERHHHGAAVHHHSIKVHVSPTHSTVAAPDDDSTAVPAVFANATTPHSHHSMTAAIAAVIVRSSVSSYVPLAIFASRAHGPPGGRLCSLRAPPRPVLL